MERITQYRGLFLGGAIVSLLLPTYTVLATPVVNQQTNNPLDLSWLAQLSEGLAVLVVCCVILIFVLRFLNDNKKVPDPKNPETKIYEKDITNRMLIHALNEQSHQTDLLNTTLKAFKSELTEGRGNQITAIMDVGDRVNDRVDLVNTRFEQAITGMRESRTDLTGRLEKVQGSVDTVKNGTKLMSDDVSILLKETKRLAQLVESLETRLTHVDETVGNLREDMTQVKGGLNHLGERLETLVHPEPKEPPKTDPIAVPTPTGNVVGENGSGVVPADHSDKGTVNPEIQGAIS